MEFSAFKKTVFIPELIKKFMEATNPEDVQKLVDKASKLRGYGAIGIQNGFTLAFRHRDANFVISMVEQEDLMGDLKYELEWLLITVNYESLWIKFGEYPSFEYKEMTTLKSVYLSEFKLFSRELTAPFLDEARDNRILAEVKNAFGTVDW